MCNVRHFHSSTAKKNRSNTQFWVLSPSRSSESDLSMQQSHSLLYNVDSSSSSYNNKSMYGVVKTPPSYRRHHRMHVCRHHAREDAISTPPPPTPGSSRHTHGHPQTMKMETTFNKDRSITVRTEGNTVTVLKPQQAPIYECLQDRNLRSPPPNSPSMRNASTQSGATLQGNMTLNDVQKSLTDAHRYENYHPRGSDFVRQFCEKHMEKMRNYMADFTNKFPVPCQCTVEELKFRQHMRVHFMCQERSEHCLHKTTLYSFKTKIPDIWLHLMFLHLQAQSNAPLTRNHSAVANLENCWNNLPKSATKRRAFITLVTANFPNYKDQQLLLVELQSASFFDMFSYHAARKKWACFACNHPERVKTVLDRNENCPLIEGQLKEKKGRWKLFKRWRTRYFTLSGAMLSYKELQGREAIDKDDHSAIDLREIRHVKSVTNRRKRRNIPKAFEIFTEDESSYVLKAKDRKDAEEWFQCLQIAVAQAQKVKSGNSTATLDSEPSVLMERL